MNTCVIFLLVVFAAVFVRSQDELTRGVQLRLTEKGMHYAVDVGIKIMQDDLKDKAINQEGKTGDLKYKIQNLRVTKAVFANYELTPVQGVGMRGRVSGISINANGQLWFDYRKNWFVHISKTIGISLEASDIHFDMTIGVGSDESGHPTLNVKGCSAGVTHLDLDFHGGASWLYNLFSGIIEDVLKDKFGSLEKNTSQDVDVKNQLCNIAIEEINTKAKAELATFPVVKKLDEYAEIDYRLTHPPKFTQEYMDAYLKGEFKSSKNPKESPLRPYSFTVSSEAKKMLYFWVTDYTLNTAGDVYHKGGRLTASFAAWDKSENGTSQDVDVKNQTPSTLKGLLNTNKFGLLFPKMEAMYPGRPMSVSLQSFKAPKVMINTNKLTLMLYALATFKVQDKKMKIQDAFQLKFDITTTVSVQVKDDNICGKINDFNYDASVTKTSVGKNIVSLDSTFVKMILEHTVISKANPFLQKGFPLPKVDEVSLQQFEIKLEEVIVTFSWKKILRKTLTSKIRMLFVLVAILYMQKKNK